MAQRKRRDRSGRPEVRNRLQVRILAACSQREVTSKEIADREKLPPTTVGYHFRVLVKKGYLRVARKERARGVLRYYYVANRRAVITDREFEQMTEAERRGLTTAVLGDIVRCIREAQRAKTMDARSDSHVSWSPMVLDEEGRIAMKGESAWMLKRSLQIQDEASARLLKSGADPIYTAFILAAFESPNPEPPKAA